jgi:exosortase
VLRGKSGKLGVLEPEPMTTGQENGRPTLLSEFLHEFPGAWKAIPEKGLFVALFGCWLVFFDFLGNSTLGYLNSRSLFAWAIYAYDGSEDDRHGYLIPFLVLGLLWWKRKELATLQTRLWLGGIWVVAIALIMHLAGYFGQQTRISLAAFFFGIYGIMGLVWGPKVLKATFFPMCLFAFAIPLNTLAETVTFPLRVLATKASCLVAGNVLGIDVVRIGTQVTNKAGTFQFEVAAACSGMRSLTAILALCTIYGFMQFRALGRRVAIIAAAVPLAIAANVARLLTIIIVSEAFGQKYGMAVHDSAWFSLLPYIPAIVGVMVLGHFLKERTSGDKEAGNGVMRPMEQTA